MTKFAFFVLIFVFLDWLFQSHLNNLVWWVIKTVIISSLFTDTALLVLWSMARHHWSSQKKKEKKTVLTPEWKDVTRRHFAFMPSDSLSEKSTMEGKKSLPVSLWILVRKNSYLYRRYLYLSTHEQDSFFLDVHRWCTAAEVEHCSWPLGATLSNSRPIVDIVAPFILKNIKKGSGEVFL